MVEIKEGQIINLKDGKGGQGKSGNWWYKVDVKGERGSDRISVWANDPQAALNFKSGKAKVKHISSAKLGANQFQGKWYSSVSINADLEEVIGMAAEDLMAVDDSELPFM
jgi:hypothetical protein